VKNEIEKWERDEGVKFLRSEIFRVLRPTGVFSVYPKHVLEDSPLDKFSPLKLDDLIHEIMKANFNFRRNIVT